MKRTYYAVFTTTESGADYMVKGNLGHGNKGYIKAVQWEQKNRDRYPRPLWVERIKI